MASTQRSSRKNWKRCGPKTSALTIDALVDPASIDPVFFVGRMYYLVPIGPVSQEPLAIMAEAMERAECWGIG